MKNWTIGRRVTVTCAVLTLLALAANLIGIFGASSLRGTARVLSADALKGLDHLTQMQSSLLEVRGSSYMIAILGLDEAEKQKQLTRIQAQQERFEKVMTEYEASGKISTEERPLFENTKSKAQTFLGAVARFRQMDKVDPKSAIDYWNREGIQTWPAARTTINDELEFDRRAADKLSAQVEASASSTINGSWVVLVLSILASIILGIFVVRSINTALQDSTAAIRTSAEQVTAASNEIAASSEFLAQGASEQAASLEETSASGQEVSAMTHRNAENSGVAVGLMSEVDSKIAHANEKLQGMLKSMSEITSSSERIGKIIKVIDEIAFQTNILALNAAVEAARAGEAGLGFAVVADEVRNLAQRCAQAAKDTTTLIEDSVVNARQGDSELEAVANAIGEITTTAAKVKTLVEEVSHGGTEQARGVDQISRALVQMEKATQQVAANAQESASASQQLRAQAASMGSIVMMLERLTSQEQRVPRQVPVNTPNKPMASSAEKLAKVVGNTIKADLQSMQRAVGKSQPVTVKSSVVKPSMAKPEPVKPLVGATAEPSRKSGFPLDDSEFTDSF